MTEPDPLQSDRQWDAEALRDWIPISWAVSPAEYLQNPEAFRELKRLNADASRRQRLARNDGLAAVLAGRLTAIWYQFRPLVLSCFPSLCVGHAVGEYVVNDRYRA